MYKIVASPTFKICLDRLIYFLSIKYSSKLASETKQIIKNSIQKNLSENPHLAPISNRLVELGIRKYHQYAVDRHNLIFFKINEEKKEVVLLAVMDSRQEIRKLLSEVLLLS